MQHRYTFLSLNSYALLPLQKSCYILKCSEINNRQNKQMRLPYPEYVKLQGSLSMIT